MKRIVARAVAIAWMTGVAVLARAAEPLPPPRGDVWSRKPTLAEALWLEWRPTEDTGRLAGHAARAFRGKKVDVKTFVDARDDEQLIGENFEEGKRRTVRTRTDVGAWCSSQLVALLRQANMTVVEEGADLVIAGKVTDFMVEERDEYRGRVSLEVTVTDAAGKVRWSGQVVGRAKTWGRSYSAQNYLEVLSDSLLDAIDEIFVQLGT